MPNWCSNQLTIFGSAESLQTMQTAVAGPDHEGKEMPFSFERVLPTPGDLAEGREVVDWHVLHWGTKWNLVAEDLEVVEDAAVGTLVWRFDTAWSPPEKLVAALSSAHPDLVFTLDYAEADSGFAGRSRHEAGIVIEEAYSEEPEVCVSILREHWPQMVGLFDDESRPADDDQ